MRRAFRFASLSLLAACAAPPRSTVPTHAELTSAVSSAVRVPYGDLAANLALLACRRELRFALHEIRSQCAAASLGKQLQISTRAAKPVFVSPCPADLLRGVINELEDRLRLKLARVLYDQVPHEVLYFTASKPTIDKDRHRQILDLVNVPAIGNTKLLLVTSPEKGEAEADARLTAAIELLLGLGVPVERIDKPLKYPLGVTLSELSPLDSPVLPESDVSRIVYIFRVLC